MNRDTLSKQPTRSRGCLLPRAARNSTWLELAKPSAAADLAGILAENQVGLLIHPEP